MKGKILRTFFAIVMVIPMFTSVFAISAEDLLARLEGIAVDIDLMKQEYEQIITTYPDVIDALSPELKTKVETLSENLMADDIEETVKTLKEELATSSVEDADKVLEAIENLQNDAEVLINDNKDIVEQVKSGYSDLTVDEIQQVVEKAVEIVKSLGAEVDVTDTFNSMMDILDEAHTMALEMNDRIEHIIANNTETFDDALSINLVKDMLKAVENKDIEDVIDVLRNALDNAQGGAELKQDLKEVKDIALQIKDKIMEMDTLSEQDLLMFSDDNKDAVAQKIKEVEQDYIDFAKVIIDNYAEDYMQVVIDKAYNKTIDDMVRYGNTALDYYEQYEDTIDSLSVSWVLSKLPQDLVEKAGIMVALGFVDLPDFNKAYITNNFGTQIDKLVDYLVTEFEDYLDYVDQKIEEEVNDTFVQGTASAETQSALRTITAGRFKTIENVKALKNRVDKLFLSSRPNWSSKLEQAVEYVKDIYDQNIILSISATLIKENVDSLKEYEVITGTTTIVTNKFIKTKDFVKEIGIPEAYESVAKYASSANNAIKTGTELDINISSSASGSFSFAVLGDAYADGMIDARDYMIIKNYIMDGEQIAELPLIAADTYRDDLVDARDYMMIKNYIMDGTEIKL